MCLKSFLDLGPHRPRWAKLADRLISDNIPTDQNVLKAGKQANIFTQSWSMKLQGKSTLPESIKTMLQTAEKYNVVLEPLLPNITLQREMPIWHHKGINNEAKSIRMLTNQWAVCHRKIHKIKTVGKMVDYATTDLGTRHHAQHNCACPQCRLE